MKRRPRRRHAVPMRKYQPLRVFAFSVIVVLVLGTAGYLLVSAFSSRTPAPAANTIDIQADMAGFSQDEVRVRAGEPITIRLTSLDNRFHLDGGGQHQWAVDELGLNLIAPPLGSTSVSFTPDESGVYAFYCDICCGGRANPTMQGTFIVEA
jgi:cytochrome c oxidase subunit II